MDVPIMSEKGVWSEGHREAHWGSTVVLSIT